jgi:tetratricopeptide (TPR) repeat protein
MPHSNKNKLLVVWDRAGYCASDHLRAQWLERAIQLMTKEIPPTMVHPAFRINIYNNYGNALHWLKQCPNVLEAYRDAISLCRALGDNSLAKYNHYHARALMNMGVALDNLGKYDDAIVAYKEALEIYTTMSAQNPLLYNESMANALYNYAITLRNLNQVSEAAAMGKHATTLLRNLTQTENECTRLLCDALHNYGSDCYSLGQGAEAVLAYQESILTERSTNGEFHHIENTIYLTTCFTISCGDSSMVEFM